MPNVALPVHLRPGLGIWDLADQVVRQGPDGICDPPAKVRVQLLAVYGVQSGPSYYQTTHDANAYLDAVLSAAPGPGICI